MVSRFIIDTWQYFLHRAMHTNRWLYKQFHSVHHRLYVPYAFGALYNHPLEGLVLDTVGTGIAEFLACMTTREAMLLFLVSSLKTVDDHCGYSLPFDPLQLLTSNNADYHDIHHQVRRCGAPHASRGICLRIGVAGHWHQVELRTAVLRALGYHPRHPDDAQRHRGAPRKTEVQDTIKSCMYMRSYRFALHIPFRSLRSVIRRIS